MKWCTPSHAHLIVNFAERRLKDGLVRVLNPDKLNLPQHDESRHESGFEGEPPTV